MKKAFLIRHIPGPAWIEGKGFSEQPLLEHGNYIHENYKKGVVIEGGPFLDNTGGMALIVVDDDAQMKEFVANDPAIKSGVFTAEVIPWLRVDWETYG